MGRQPLGSGGAPSGLAPSIDFGGSAIQDPRLPYNTIHSSAGPAAIGWLSTGFAKLTMQAPSTIAVANIAAAANPTSGTPLALITSTAAGITVVPAGGTFALPNYSNVIPAGAVAIDGLPGWLAVNGKYNSGFYNPLMGISRCVSVTGVASGIGGTVTIKGADWYGYPMTQTVTLAAGVNTVNTTKAFKFVTSVTPNFTDTHTVSVGTADVYGLNMAVDDFSDVMIYWAGVLQLTATVTPAVATTASATTGDVRGTFAAGSASNGTKTLAIFVQPNATRLTSTPQSVGLFGVAQF